MSDERSADIPENSYLPAHVSTRINENLANELTKFTPPSEPRRNEISTTDLRAFHAQTPLQSIAAQLARLTYEDMMLMAKDLHADSEIVGKTPADTADLIHKWAKRELEKASKL